VLTPGSTLGPYEIVALIGSGGMGEVYRARDPRLGRDVAVKVLPASIGADPGRLRRFEQEARAAAALNHPNIVTIYSVERADGVPFVTMELVDGAALSTLIPRDGMPLGRTLPIAIALGDAVAAAHARGIVHRDLKPSNIMIAAGDRVKVLDFGLAKLVRPEPAEADETALAGDPVTDPGSVVGTLPYMSPEQVQGQPVDHRSDIFSLGVVLYEMATGRRPFKGETNALLLSSILKDTPPLASDIGDVPRELGRIIRHSLAKDPGRRYQTAVDLRNELAELQQDLSSGSLQTSAAPARSRWSARSAGVAAALIVTALVAAGYTVWRVTSSPFRTAPPLAAEFRQLTTAAGVKQYPSLSPDGKWVVYEGTQSGNAAIYLQSVGGQNAIDLTKDSPDDDTQPAFSPDGESIAFRSSRQGGGIFVMGRTGESVRRLSDSGYNPAWSPDGTKIVYATDVANILERGANSELWTVAVATGEKQRIFQGDAVQPNWSPHGLRIAFWKIFGDHLGQRDIATIPAGGGAPVPVTLDPAIDWSPVWSPDGRFLFFSSDRGGTMNLWRVPIDERTGATLGPPEPLSAPASYAAHISVSADGRSLAFTAFSSGSTIQSASFDPAAGAIRGAATTVVGGSRPVSGPSPSPDGRWIAFFSLAPQLDIFVTRADGSGLRQLTNDKANDRNPTWSPDGTEIRFMSNRSGQNQVWTMNADGSGARPLTAVTGGAGTFGVSTTDGSKMVIDPTGSDHVVVIDPRLDPKAQKPAEAPGFVSPNVDFNPWSWSPDGTELAGTACGPPTYHGALVVYSFATRTFSRVHESLTAVSPIFLSDGRRLLFQDGSKIMLLDRTTHATRELLSVAPDTMDLRWSIARDERTIYFVRQVQQSDIWVMRTK
jgi:Tol biopolymer transport system component